MNDMYGGDASPDDLVSDRLESKKSEVVAEGNSHIGYSTPIDNIKEELAYLREEVDEYVDSYEDSRDKIPVRQQIGEYGDGDDPTSHLRTWLDGLGYPVEQAGNSQRDGSKDEYYKWAEKVDFIGKTLRCYDTIGGSVLDREGIAYNADSDHVLYINSAVDGPSAIGVIKPDSVERKSEVWLPGWSEEHSRTELFPVYGVKRRRNGDLDRGQGDFEEEFVLPPAGPEASKEGIDLYLNGFDEDWMEVVDLLYMKAVEKRVRKQWREEYESEVEEDLREIRRMTGTMLDRFG